MGCPADLSPPRPFPLQGLRPRPRGLGRSPSRGRGREGERPAAGTDPPNTPRPGTAPSGTGHGDGRAGGRQESPARGRQGSRARGRQGSRAGSDGDGRGGGRQRSRAGSHGEQPGRRPERNPGLDPGVRGGAPHAAEPHIDAVGRTGPEVHRRKCPRARIPRAPGGSVVRPAVRRTVLRRRGRISGRRSGAQRGGPGRSPAGCKGRSPLIREGAGQGTPPPETLPSPHPQGPGRQCRASRGQAYRPEETRPYLRSAVRRTTGGAGAKPRGVQGAEPLDSGRGGTGDSTAGNAPEPAPQGPARQCRASRGQAYRPEETRPYLRSAVRRTTGGGRGEAPRGARGGAP
ncbi:hypothetical protein CFP59_06688 [Streptomyces malaysiensis subsp. malaysiensis]|nr:hypothetical protein CFP59_06688 [Streptomyces sp. M56]